MRNTFSGKLLFYIGLLIIILNLEALGTCLRGWDVKLIRAGGFEGKWIKCYHKLLSCYPEI